MWHLKYHTNELIYETHLQRTKSWLPRERVSRGGIEWEFEVSRFKLLHIEWINNKALLCSTGNYTQCPMIKRNVKYGKQCMCTHTHTRINIYRYLNHFAYGRN